MWGPRSIAKLVNITPITMVYGTYNELVTGANLNQLIAGGPHIVDEPSDGQKRWFFINDEKSLAKSREIFTNRLSGFHVLSFYLEYGTSSDLFCAA